MKNITVFISSFLGRGHRWQLAALVALFFVAGCTVELYPPAQEVNNLPDGGKVDVLPDTIPRAFAFGPRIYWSQIVASDSSYSIAVTDANNKGRWLDSLRWVPSGPFVTVNGDTLSTRAYARDNSGVTGDNQILTYNGSGSLTIEDGNTVDMSDLLDNTDAQTIDTLTLQGDTMLQVSLSGDGAPVKELDLSALRSVVDSTRLTQDSILVYYQDGAEVGRDTIAGTGGGGADNLGNHIMTQNLQTNGNWISGDGGNEGIGVDAAGKIGIGTLTPSYALDINSTDAVRLPVGTTAQNPIGATGLLRYNSDSTAFTGYYNAQWNKLIDFPSLSTSSVQSATNYWTKSGSNLYYNSGKVGIGINPTSTFHMTGTVSSSNPPFRADITTSGANQSMMALNSSEGGGFFVQDVASSGFIPSFIFQSSGINGVGGILSARVPSANDVQTGSLAALIIQGEVASPLKPLTGSNVLSIRNRSIELITVDKDGRMGFANYAPTATLHLKAGTATANTAPLKFTSGTNLTTPEAGAVEWDGTNLYITQTTGPTRKTIAYVDTDDGSASDTTDGSGDITVSHTLGSASITVTATATGTTFYHVQVHSKTSTTFKIRFYNSPGSAATSTAVTADWIAKLQ